MTYQVTINYKRGPAFSTTAAAADKEAAIKLVNAFARSCGFDAPVVSVKAFEVPA
jgi:hypothetical protein